MASDFARVIREIQERSRALNASTIKEIRTLMPVVGNISFYHERRDANMDVHSIARNSGAFEPGRYVWLIEPPDYVNLSINNQ